MAVVQADGLIESESLDSPEAIMWTMLHCYNVARLREAQVELNKDVTERADHLASMFAEHGYRCARSIMSQRSGNSHQQQP